MVARVRSYLSDEEDVENVLLVHGKDLARFIFEQMKAHYWETPTDYRATVARGFQLLRPQAFNVPNDRAVRPFRQPVVPAGVIVESSRNPTLRTLRSGAGSLSQPVSLGRFGSGLAEQASWNVDQRELSSLLWQFVGVGFHDYLDSFVAGVDFDPHGTVFKIDFVPSARFAADDGMGHVRACGMLKG